MFGFTVAVDISDYPLDNNYIKDLRNYHISDNSWRIDSIIPYSEIDDVDPNVIKYFSNSGLNPSHFVYISTRSLSDTELQIALKYQEFPWIIETGTGDDSDPDENSTFGFSELMGGISNAYQRTNNEEYYFRIIFNIDQ